MDIECTGLLVEKDLVQCEDVGALEKECLMVETLFRSH